MLYLAQVLVYTAAMLLVYGLFLRNRTLYQFSRFYLLACAVLPLFIPFIQLPDTFQQQIRHLVYFQFELPAVTVNATRKLVATPAGIPLFWFWYCSVVMLFITWQVITVYRLWRVIHSHKKIKHDGCILVLNSGYGPGSFGKYILFPEEELNKTILAHEQAHIQLHHTRDLVFLNLLQAILWPNLLLLWIKKEIKQVHEFQADAVVDVDIRDYVQLLLCSVFNTRSVPVMHSFIIHPIKRRIMMLHKNGKASPLKTTIQVSAALIFSAITAIGIQSCVKKSANVSDTGNPAMDQFLNKLDKIKPKISKDGSGVYQYTDKMPHANYDINSFLSQNLYYPESARKMGIEGRVIVRFIVDEYGNVTNPVIEKSPDSSLSNETIRVISLMPKWAAGEDKGKAVPVYFTLPVVFSLGK